MTNLDVTGSALEARAFRLPDGLTLDQWAEAGRPIAQRHESSLWWVGDWLVYARQHFEHDTESEAEIRQRIAEVTDLDPVTVREARRVAAAFRPSRRRNLSWSHHQAVAGLEAHEADLLLTDAQAEGLSLREVRARARRLASAINPDEPAGERPPACFVTGCHEPAVDQAPVRLCVEHCQQVTEWFTTWSGAS